MERAESDNKRLIRIRILEEELQSKTRSFEEYKKRVRELGEEV